MFNTVMFKNKSIMQFLVIKWCSYCSCDCSGIWLRFTVEVRHCSCKQKIMFYARQQRLSATIEHLLYICFAHFGVQSYKLKLDWFLLSCYGEQIQILRNVSSSVTGCQIRNIFARHVSKDKGKHGNIYKYTNFVYFEMIQQLKQILQWSL